jgi:hypothetical protein
MLFATAKLILLPSNFIEKKHTVTVTATDSDAVT